MNLSPTIAAAAPAALKAHSRPDPQISSRAGASVAAGTAPGSPRGGKKRLDFRIGIAAFAVTVIVINTVIVIENGRSQLREVVADAVAQNSGVAAQFEQFTVRTLASAEALAHAVLRAYAHRGAETPLAEMHANREIDPLLFVAASIVDETGRLVASTDPMPESGSLDAAQSEAFAVHAAQDSGRLFVGLPAHHAPSGQTLVPLSMRHSAPDGSFAGFVLLHMEPARFIDFAQAASDKDDVLLLVGVDGIARARRIGGVFSAGEDLRASSMFTELATRHTGDALSASPVDGVRRFFSFRRLANYPLVAGAAVSEAKAIAAVSERTKWYYVRAVVLTAIIALLTGLVIRALSRRERAMELLLASQETLRIREEEFRTLTESMPQLVWITEADGRHTYFNRQWVDYTGLSLEQSVAAWENAFHPTEQRGALLRWKQSVAKGELYEAEYRLRRADGAYRWMLARALPLRDGDGKITKWFGTSTDIDNQVVAQARLRDQADLLNLTRDAIIVREADDTISFWNRAAERIYGWRADEVIGHSAQDFASAHSSKTLAAKKHLADFGEWSGEAEHLRKDGSTVTVSSRWTAVPNERRTAASVLVVNTDVTENKKLEAQLLRNQRLESIGTLASGVAHDLNNVLAPIMMAAPLLRKEMPAAKRSKLVAILEQSAERGAAIVRQVLTFARGADGDRVLLQPIYALNEIAQIATDTFPKSITVEVEYPEDLTLIEADPTRLHQVLLNLCVNARDAMPDGGTLSIAAENFDVDAHYAAMTSGLNPGRHLCIEVTDTGSGIHPDVMDKIFDPFFTTKGIGDGTGLGLSTVLGIVKDYGGTVDAESNGRGTTFRILLPAAAGAFQSSATAGPENLPHGNGETILVVDDEDAIRAVAEPLLRQHGYEVLLAADGPAALAVFAEHSAKIALVLTDLAMPIMSGITLARTLRKMQPDARIIISAGREDDCHPAEMDEIGVIATLAKPYTQTALLRLLNQTLSPQPNNL